MLASFSAVLQSICALSLSPSHMHSHTRTLQYASGQRWCENAICSHTIRSTLAAVHTMPCLFITAWHMAMMVIDFIEASPYPSTTPSPLPQSSKTPLPLHTAAPRHLSTQQHPAASPQQLWQLQDLYFFLYVSRRQAGVIANEGLWSEWTDRSIDCTACAVGCAHAVIVHSGLGLCICEGEGDGEEWQYWVLLQWDRHRWFKPKGTRTVNNTRWQPQRLHVRGLMEPEDTH